MSEPCGGLGAAAAAGLALILKLAKSCADRRMQGNLLVGSKIMTAIRVIIWLVLSFALAMAHPVSDAKKKQVRDRLQLEFARQTDQDLKEFFAKAKQGTHEDMQLAAQGIKSMLYNVAYSKYRCILENVDSAQNTQLCFEKARREQMMWVESVRSTGMIAPVGVRCDTESRLFGAEIEFPPYSFFGEASLFDFARLTECLKKTGS